MQKPIYSWKRAPFIRMLVPLISGIVFQFNANLSTVFPAAVSIGINGPLYFSYVKTRIQFKWYWINGPYPVRFLLGLILLNYHDVSKSISL